MTPLFVSLAILSASLLVNAIPAKRQALAQVITSCTVPNTAALTFDDGPYLYTGDVAQTLTAAGANGTFFFNGNNWDCIYAPENMQHIQAAYAMGHQIASHTWAHLDLATLSHDQIDSEMGRTEQALQRIVGITPAFTRPPYGSYNALVQQVAAAHNQKLVTWDFDSGDSTGSTPAQSQAAYDTLADQHPPNVLTLNHEVYEQTAHVVLPHAISVLKAKGYNLVTVADCLGMAPYLNIGTPQTGPFSC